MSGSSVIQRLKKEYVSYYEDVPVQKYATMAIARDEDTIIRWRKDDPRFADAVQRAKANWVRKRVIATKAEFALERLEREVFNPQATMDYENRAELASTREKIRDFLDLTNDINPTVEMRGNITDAPYDIS